MVNSSVTQCNVKADYSVTQEYFRSAEVPSVERGEPSLLSVFSALCHLSLLSVFRHQVKVSSDWAAPGGRAVSKQNRAHDLLMIAGTGVRPGHPAPASAGSEYMQ